MIEHSKIQNCAICESEFDASERNFGKGRQKYCGPKCRQKADNKRHWARRNPPKSDAELRRLCVICGVHFSTDAHHPNALTCSVKCSDARMNAERRRDAANRYDARREIECAECGTKVIVGKFSAKTGPRAPKFCSTKCAGRSAQRAYYHRNARVHDGRLNTKSWKDAKKLASARDGNKCCACGNEGERISVHHKFHLTEAEMNNHELDNLISLCGKCHNAMHDIKIGRQGDEFVISGPVFGLLGIKKVRIV